MVHYYRYRKGMSLHRMWCEGKFVEPTAEIQFTASPHNATCPKCLDSFIGQYEVYLAKMKAARNATQENAQG